VWQRRKQIIFYWGIALLALAGLWSQQAWAQSRVTNWAEPVNLSNTPQGSAWPAIVADNSGLVHVFWSEDTQGEPVNPKLGPGNGDSVFYTRGDGTSWSQTTDILFVQGKPFRFLSATVDDTGQLHLATSGSPLGPLYYTSASVYTATSARAWRSPVALDQQVGDVDIVADPRGVLHLVYAKDVNWGDHPGIFYIQSTNGGDTWSLPVDLSGLLSNTESRPQVVQLALDGQGRLHVVWDEMDPMTGVGQRIRYARSLDGGPTWSTPREVAIRREGESTVAWPRIATVGNDVHIVWIQGERPYRYHQWSSDGGETWTNPTRIFGEMHSAAGGDDLTVDSAGTMHFVANLRYPQGIYHSYWAGGGWSDLTPIYLIQAGTLVGRIGPDGIVRGYQDWHVPRMAISEGNRLHLVLQDQLRGEIWYMAGQIDAPYVPPEPLPMPVPVATSTPAPTMEPVATPSPRPYEQEAASSNVEPGNTRLGSPSFAVVTGIAPALLLVAVVVLVRLERRGRR
jgi:hypothetical protein